jgi:hypothetical protein
MTDPTSTLAEASAREVDQLLERRDSRRRHAPVTDGAAMAALDTRKRQVPGGGAGLCGATAVDHQAAEAMVR